MRFFLLMLVSVFLISGCCSLTAPIQGTQQPPVVPPQQDASGVNTNGAGENEKAGNEIEAVPEETKQDGIPSGGNVAETQQECATMTPTCESCIAKSGCGWCKSSNACYLGDESGPSGDMRCQPVDWSVNEEGCMVVADESDCSKITNCVSCLSGTGCKWCIQGSKCAGTSSSESCFGGWLNISYQCNYASR